MKLEVSFILILLFIIIYSALIQVYTILFRITGLTKEQARFQVISLLTTCGFTTTESENITKDQGRRKIAIAAMITGGFFNVIIVSLVITMISSFNSGQTKNTIIDVLIATGIFLVIVGLSFVPPVKRKMDELIEAIARKAKKDREKKNIITILDTYGKDEIANIEIHRLPDVLRNKSLIESEIKTKYGINVLMVKKGNRSVTLTPNLILTEGEEVLVFGPTQKINGLFTTAKTQMSEIASLTRNYQENVITMVEKYADSAMEEVIVNVVPNLMKDQKIGELHLPEFYHVMIFLLTRDGKTKKPEDSTILHSGDVLMVFGTEYDIQKLFETNL